ncbi:hypothetical protein TNCV_1273871 [Trichonephila clavipes]|nr:hypothetical protein TNCV_1273871 [Trichonephila clavipes]
MRIIVRRRYPWDVTKQQEYGSVIDEYRKEQLTDVPDYISFTAPLNMMSVECVGPSCNDTCPGGKYTADGERCVEEESDRKTINARFKTHFREKIPDSGRRENWSSIVVSPISCDLPRLVDAANFRITAGLEYLMKHPYRFGLAFSPA